jgi:hypothetical protein
LLGAVVLTASLLAACGDSPRNSASATQTSDQRDLSRRDRHLAATVTRLTGLLRDPAPLDRAAYQLLERTVPDQLPFLPRSTQRVQFNGLHGRYWVAPGVVGAERSPGVCLYSLVPRSASSVGAGCFDLATVRAGRAIALFPDADTTDVVGVVPSSATKVRIAAAKGKRRAEVRPINNVYATNVRFRPDRAIVFCGVSRATIDLFGDDASSQRCTPSP